MSKKKIQFSYREFLNKAGFHQDALILIESGFRGRNQLQISDCSNSIFLRIEHHNKLEFDNSIYKLDILINGLTAYKNWLIENKENLLPQRKKNRKKNAEIS